MSNELKENKNAPGWHAQELEQILDVLGASPEGLTLNEAAARLERFGPNVLQQAERESPLTLIWRQINSPLIYVLLASAFIAVAMGKFLDGMVVLGVVVLNAIVGFIQEYKAGRAIEALSALVPEFCSIIRNGVRTSAPAADVVPGDIVALDAGDKVPADVRLISTHNLFVDESALTGESVPVEKECRAVESAAPVAERVNMSYSGTLVTYGAGKGVVVATGGKTELGRISSMLKEATEIATPLTIALSKVSSLISLAIVVISVVMLILGLIRGYSLIDSLLAAITLAVAAIPEGLPSIITIALAIGVKRMARRHAIIRHLPAVETLGSTTVICSDKTGTLTKNEMTVKEIWAAGTSFEITGTGYSFAGAVKKDSGVLSKIPPEIYELLLGGALCNDAAIAKTENGDYQLAGDPTEGALVACAEKVGLKVDEVRQSFPRKDTLPFESERKFMATLHERASGNNVLFLKGAPEVVLQRCGRQTGASEFDLTEVEKQIERLAGQGMRVLAIASYVSALDSAEQAVAEAGRDFCLLGLQGLIDPPRPEAVAAIKACRDAGITVKMITGDHLGTAKAIGRELGLEQAEEGVAGAALDALSDEDLRLLASKTSIFARVAPEHKLRLVRALQANGEIVAMTGDGVNDAPALKQANIGVAMGIAGTAVSKQSADIVLTDDNFSSIAAAVEEGRRVYDNLIKSLAFVLPTNLGEAMIVIVAIMFFPIVRGEILMPIMPVQILWVNLVATVALALPLGFEAMEPNIMKRPPRAPGEPLLSRFVVFRTLVVTALITIGGVGLFLYEYYNQGGGATAIKEAQTMAVTTVVLMQIFYLLNCRSLRDSVLEIGIFSNPSVYYGIILLIILQAGFIYLPFMNVLFGSAPLDLDAWAKATGASLIVLPVISVEKWWRKHRLDRQNA